VVKAAYRTSATRTQENSKHEIPKPKLKIVEISDLGFRI
jgi:hypothetical protein